MEVIFIRITDAKRFSLKTGYEMQDGEHNKGLKMHTHKCIELNTIIKINGNK